MPIVNVTDISRDHVAEAIARMEMDITTVARSHKGLSSGHLKLLRELQSLTAENAALRKERDSYRFRSEQIWGLRKEIQAALGVPAGCEGEEALKRGLESIEALRAAAVEVCALARVWATVWHDKLSTDSLQRFAELEQQILKGAKL